VKRLAILLAPVAAAGLVGCASSPAARTADDEVVMFEDERRAATLPASPGVERAEALLARGDAAAARDLLTAEVEARPTDARAQLDLGLAYEMLERPAEAEAAYRAAVAARPDFAEALNNLGVVLRARGASGEAVEVLRRAVAANGELVSAQLNLALALQETGDLDGALAGFRRVMELSPREPRSRLEAGFILLEAGEAEAAQRVFLQAARLSQGDRALLSSLGNGLRRAGDAPAAIRVLRQAIEAEASPAPPPVLAELALAEYAADHRGDAEATLTALLEGAPDYAIAHYLLANMLASREAWTEAARGYRAYLALEPEGAQAARARRRLALVEARR
jgi:Tfp pilus assembly protein PilF